MKTLKGHVIVLQTDFSLGGRSDDLVESPVVVKTEEIATSELIEDIRDKDPSFPAKSASMLSFQPNSQRFR